MIGFLRSLKEEREIKLSRGSSWARSVQNYIKNSLNELVAHPNRSTLTRRGKYIVTEVKCTSLKAARTQNQSRPPSTAQCKQ